MIVANIFDFIDGKVAHITNTVSRFGAFWDSTLDRFSDIALFLGLIYLYADLRRTDYVMVAALAMMFSIMTSYARARAESLIEKCKVGFMERPERIVLFMIGAFTEPMAAVLWVILILSIVTVANRIHYTYLVLNDKPMPTGSNPISAVFWRAFFWRDERASAALRLVGDRHPRVRVADAARLAARSDRRGPGHLGAGSDSPTATMEHADPTRLKRSRVLLELGTFGPVLAVKLYRITLDPRAAVADSALPRSRSHAARGRRAAHRRVRPGAHLGRPP